MRSGLDLPAVISLRRPSAGRIWLSGNVLVALALASCGTSGAQDPVDYAADAGRLAAEHGDQVTAIQGAGELALLGSIEALRGQVDSGAISAEQFGLEAFATTRSQTIALFAAIGDATDRFISDLEALRPPEAVAQHHHAYIEALRSASAGIAPLLTALGGADEFDELEPIITASGFVDAQQRLGASCRLLQAAVAEAANLAVDLRCVQPD